MCRVVIGVVSDIGRAAKGSPAVRDNSDALVGSLQRILQSPACARELKPLAITALGDVAAAVGGRKWMDCYLAASMAIFAAAGAIEIGDEEDLEEVDFVCELRLALIEAITWILQAGREDGSAESMVPYLADQVIPWLLRRIVPWCLQELGQGSSLDGRLLDSIVRAVSGLVGDLAGSGLAGGELRGMLRPLAGEFLRLEGGVISDSTRQTQRWALSVLL